jgi:hypothetical protein
MVTHSVGNELSRLIMWLHKTFSSPLATRLFCILMAAYIIIAGIPVRNSTVPSSNIDDHSNNNYNASSIVSAYAASDDDTWYLGKNVQKDMFVTYTVQQMDTNNGRPFEMTIYFKDKDNNGNWIAPVFVMDRGQVSNGTLKLSSISLSPLGGQGSNIPDELAPYINAYSNSLTWLDAYATKADPKSLSASSWGVIAAIGGSEIKPSGTEKVTVPAGTFDTTVIRYHKSVDNNIWISKDFPYPIKAQTFAEVSSGQPPVQYSYQLENTGTSQQPPPIPKSVTEIPTPPLNKQTARGTYNIVLNWQPESIKPGKNTTFVVGLSDNTGTRLNFASYDFTIKDANGTIVKEFKNEQANGGLGRQLPVTFDKTGTYEITVLVNSVAGEDTGVFTEDVSYHVVVVPEFPEGVSGFLVAGIVIGTTSMLASRFASFSKSMRR